MAGGSLTLHRVRGSVNSCGDCQVSLQRILGLWAGAVADNVARLNDNPSAVETRRLGDQSWQVVVRSRRWSVRLCVWGVRNV